MNNQDNIKFLRENGFNCFPIPEGHKIADHRYRAEQTITNQGITEVENYGYIPVRGAGTCILDFDDKEFFREFAQENITNGIMVVESPHGWHMPVCGISGEVDKVELFHPQKTTKKIMEIQGPKHYCVGPGSTTEDGIYKINNQKIWNAKEMEFHDLIENFVKKWGFIGRHKNPSSKAHLREKFREGKPPGDGQSNDYFFEAAKVCNTEGISREDAVKQIEVIYEKWQQTKHYSGRPWSNILVKIDDVYDNDYKVSKGGNKKKAKQALDIAKDIMSNYRLFSDRDTRKLYVTDDGFLEDVTTAMKKTITKEYESGRSETEEVMHFLIGFADELPELNYENIMFADRMFNLKHNIDMEKDPNIICAIGFKDYNYIECPECPRFTKLIDEHVSKKSKNNLLACLSMAVAPEKETRMSVFYGPPGTGKTTLAETLSFALGQDAACAMKVDDFFGDRASEARIKGKVLLYFQDTPKTWKDWSKIKVTTGENSLSIRDMYQKSESIRNMLSVIISTNHLIEIDEDEEAPMFDRLALVHFQGKVRGTSQENKDFSVEVARDEGEAIISYCLNLRKDGHQFDSSENTQLEWNEIIKPEEILFREHFHYKEFVEKTVNDKIIKSENMGLTIREVKELLQNHYPNTKFDDKKINENFEEYYL